MTSLVVQVARLAAAAIDFFMAVKIGGFILKLILGLAAIALVWWFVANMIH
ncbi:MAG TPA: hypothetical protein VFY06_06610 [Verrucomicrobiae bacterium]|nr:hypothetical protein [Verrucomicrobiae bacterium]